MTIFGILVLWGAYTTGLWGYCLLRGYDVTPGNLVNWNYPASLTGSATTTTRGTGTGSAGVGIRTQATPTGQ